MILLVWTLGCTGKEPVDTGEPPPLAVDDTADCNAHPPVVSSLTVGDGGTITAEDGSTQPSVLFEVGIEDDDGDLDIVSLKLWIDDTVDGAVDTSGAADRETNPTQVRDEPCGVYAADFDFRLGVTGSPLDFETPYDFAITAVDSHGVESAPAIASGTTPAPLPEK